MDGDDLLEWLAGEHDVFEQLLNEDKLGSLKPSLFERAPSSTAPAPSLAPAVQSSRGSASSSALVLDKVRQEFSEKGGDLAALSTLPAPSRKSTTPPPSQPHIPQISRKSSSLPPPPADAHTSASFPAALADPRLDEILKAARGRSTIVEDEYEAEERGVVYEPYEGSLESGGSAGRAGAAGVAFGGGYGFMSPADSSMAPSVISGYGGIGGGLASATPSDRYEAQSSSQSQKSGISNRSQTAYNNPREVVDTEAMLHPDVVPDPSKQNLYHPLGSMEFSPGQTLEPSYRKHRRSVDTNDLVPEEIPPYLREDMYDPVSSASHSQSINSKVSRYGSSEEEATSTPAPVPFTPVSGNVGSSNSSYPTSINSNMSLGKIAAFDLDRALGIDASPILPPAKSDKAPPVRAPEEYKPSMGEEYTGGEAAQKVKPKKGISFEIGSTPAKKRRPDSASKARPGTAQRSAQAQAAMPVKYDGAGRRREGRSESAPRAQSAGRAREPAPPPSLLLRASMGPHSLAAVKERVEGDRTKVLSHRPTFFTPKSSRVGPVGEEWVEERSKDRKDYWIKMGEKKALLEAQAVEGFTGKPKVGRGPEHPMFEEDLPPSERLYRYAEVWTKKRAERLAAKEAAESEPCTFQPQRVPQNEKKLPEDYVPIYERVDEVVKKRQEELAKKAQDLHPKPSFAPALNAHSMRMMETRDLRDDLTANERIARGYGAGARSASADPRRPRSESGLAPHTSAHVPVSELHCTFQPRINPQSRLIAELDPNRPQSVQERFKFYEEQRLRRQIEIEEAQELQSRMPFKPDIKDRSGRVLERSSQSYILTESYLEKVERLATRDVERREMMRNALAESIYGKFDFKPRINPASKKLVPRPTDLEEMVENSRNKLIKEHNMVRYGDLDKKGCTFKPDLSKPKIKGAAFEAPSAEQRIVDFKSDPDYMMAKIRAYLKQKEEHLAKKKEEQIRAEEAACTFNPKVSTEIPKEVLNGGPVLVPGLGKFLDKQHRAKQLESEQKEREDKAFWANAAQLPVKAAPTVPEPFRLSVDQGWIAQRAEVKRQELENDLRRHEEQNFTFKPQTNEGKRAAQLREILGPSASETREMRKSLGMPTSAATSAKAPVAAG